LFHRPHKVSGASRRSSQSFHWDRDQLVPFINGKTSILKQAGGMKDESLQRFVEVKRGNQCQQFFDFHATTIVAMIY
jgi:hypothetical protein